MHLSFISRMGVLCILGWIPAGMNIWTSPTRLVNCNCDASVLDTRDGMSLFGRVNNSLVRKLIDRLTGGVVTKTCCTCIEALPDMSLGTTKLKFSKVLRVLPTSPWDWYFPMNKISPRSVDGDGQADDPQATMPITRLTSSSPASAL